MHRETVTTQEKVTVQLIKGVAPSPGESTENGCGIPSITFDRVVQGVPVQENERKVNDNNN